MNSFKGFTTIKDGNTLFLSYSMVKRSSHLYVVNIGNVFFPSDSFEFIHVKHNCNIGGHYIKKNPSYDLLRDLIVMGINNQVNQGIINEPVAYYCDITEREIQAKEKRDYDHIK